MSATVTAGQPLRALSLAGLGLGLWLAVRLPAMEQDFAAARLALAPPGAMLAATGPGTAQFAANEPPPLAPLPLAPLLPDAGAAAPSVAALPAEPDYGWPALAAAAPAYWPPVPRTVQRRREAGAGFNLPLPSRPLAVSASTAARPLPAPAGAARPSSGAGDLAAAAYARLAEGDRRGALRLFNLALASDDGDPRRGQWIADRRGLTKRWSLEAYSLVRDPGVGGVGAAASPVLGGGQSGAIVAWAINPLARRRVSLVARLTAATGNGGQLDNTSTQAAFGARWQVLPGVSLSAERLVALGFAARNDWTLRLAAGADGHRGRLHWSAYGEAGVLGSGLGYGGGQARAMVEVVRLGKAHFEFGPGVWGSVQTGPVTLGRLDFGPSLSTTLPLGRTRLDITADWRQRVAGQALPGSGPALTLSTHF